MTAHSDRLPGFFRRRDENPPSSGSESGAGEDNKSSKAEGGTVTGGGHTQEPVVVWEAANDLEAQIVKGRLESAGIPAIVQGEALGTIYGLTTGSLAAANILVPGPLADKAIALLESEVEWDDAIDDSMVDGSMVDGSMIDDDNDNDNADSDNNRDVNSDDINVESE